jgi:hypothetical protein
MVGHSAGKRPKARFGARLTQPRSIVNQAAGGERQGNPNFLYYLLAASQYGFNGNASCNSTLGIAFSTM